MSSIKDKLSELLVVIKKTRSKSQQGFVDPELRQYVRGYSDALLAIGEITENERMNIDGILNCPIPIEEN